MGTLNGRVLDMHERTWQDMIDVNLTGAWHTLKAAAPHIRAGGRGGSVIMISSGAAIMPPPGLVVPVDAGYLVKK